MNVLRKLALTFAAAALLAPVARAQDAVPLPPPPEGAQQLTVRPAAASRDGGWNTQYGMLFSLQNVFTRQTILEGYEGGVGLQYNLAPTAALRFSVDASRTSNPPVESETTVSMPATATTPAFTTTSKSLDVPSGPTSTFGVGVSGSYLVRLGTDALAPYLGGGLSLGYASSAREYDDKTNVARREQVNDVARSFDVGLLGQLGLEWRVHKSVSFFAEYGVGVSAFNSTTAKEDTKVTTSTGTTQTKSEYTRNRFFNFDTGLTQGGALGVVAFF